jgi:hypothetical protein
MSAVAVVVPARDEEQDIEACLTSIRTALGRLSSGVATAVTVVLDRCTDRTPQQVDAILTGWAGAVALHVAAVGGHRGPARGAGPAHIVAGSGVGALRDLGVRDALRRLRPHPPRSVWVLTTDADTTVPPDWALAHLVRAGRGAVGVAGMADPVAPVAADGPSPRAALRHEMIVRNGIDHADGERHRHVYGANLGVRGDAYIAVGGFPPDGPGEDHGLWSRLRATGHRLEQPTAVRVRTSARTVGRATGGLADLLRDLDEPGA